MLTSRTLLFLLGTAALLPLMGLAIVLWRRYYREDADNTARRVVKNSAVPFILRLIVRALDMIFAIVLFSTLSGADIGPYTLAALLVSQYLGTFTEFGLGVLLTRQVARDPAVAPKLFGITLFLRWLLTLVAAAPIAALLIGLYGLLGSFRLSEPISPMGQQAIWVLLLTLIPGAYSQAVTALYNAAERMEVPALIELVTAVLSFLARIGVIVLGFGILGLAWAAVGVSTITALIYCVLQVRSFFRPTLRWDWQIVKELVPQTLPLMLNNLLTAVFFRFDTFIIKAFGGGQGDLLVQQYDVAYRIISIATILPPVVTFAVFPVLARRALDTREGLAQAQNRTLQALLMLAFPLAMGICVLSSDLVHFFTRRNAEQYLPISAQVLSILAWFLPLSFVNGLLQYVLIAVERQRAITRAFIVGTVFNLTANLSTIPWFGLYAASIITILSEVVLFSIFLPLLRREGLAPPLFTLSWRPALAALLMGGTMLITHQLSWLVAIIIAPPVYSVALWLLGAFGVEERALARRVLGRL